MRSLYLRIWLTVVAALLLFALVSGWLLQFTLERERSRADSALAERVGAWGELIQRSLPAADAPLDEQAAALREWSQRLRLPLALDDADGARIAASDSFLRREQGDDGLRRALPIRLEDGRTLSLMHPNRAGRGGGEPGVPRWLPPAWRSMHGVGLLVLLVLLFAAVAAGAYPVVRRLTRRLETLERGVEAFGGGALHQRVAESGHDEVAKLAASFNRAAAHIEALVRSHRSLLANASHELRSPLARLKMALAMQADGAPLDAVQRERTNREIATDIAELDALVEEILFASRLDAGDALEQRESVDLLALAAEEASRTGAIVGGEPLGVLGDERLLRRALRNLLENARSYGGDDVGATLARDGAGRAELRVCDRGPGVPEAFRERIFEPFFRLPGHAEREGGSGLGLALVRQIAERHGGRVHCEPRVDGGSCFVLKLPLA